MDHALTLPKDIQLAKTHEAIRSCYPLILQLRPHISDEDLFVKQIIRQIEDGYHLVYIQDEEGIKALAGFRLLEFLAWGKILYVDDLITDTNFRKTGHGSKLLKWLIEHAKKVGCNQVHLDSGSHRHDAHRLYLNHGFKIIGYHFSLDFSGIKNPQNLDVR